MKRVDCVGMVGKYPTPKGSVMFYDTGRTVSPVDLAEALALQHSAFTGSGASKEEAKKKAYKFVEEIAKKVNVYPVGYAALTDDGRILVTEPWFESKEA